MILDASLTEWVGELPSDIDIVAVVRVTAGEPRGGPPPSSQRAIIQFDQHADQPDADVLLLAQYSARYATFDCKRFFVIWRDIVWSTPDWNRVRDVAAGARDDRTIQQLYPNPLSNFLLMDRTNYGDDSTKR